jgi:hypothetical protein
MKTIALLCAACALLFQATATETSQDFGRVELDSKTDISLKLIWSGDKKPENVKASFYISQGPIRDIFSFVTLDDVKKLHTTLGKMIEVAEAR